MNFEQLFMIFFLFFVTQIFGQNSEKPKMLKDEYGKEYFYDDVLKAKIYEIDGERVVIMDEMYILPKPKFNNQLDRNYYYFLNKRLVKVYPLFVTALEQYRNLQSELESLDSKEKRKYIKEKQQILAQEYEAKLRDLTTSEGQIFTKLMNRATGKTVYEIIKELKGGFSAITWNIKGNIADVDIKREYNPYKNRDDEFIENLLISSWRLGYLKPYKGYETFSVKK